MKKPYVYVPLFVLTLGGLVFLCLYNRPLKPNASFPLPYLDPVLVYNKEFAQRFGLDPQKAIDLDPGVYAISRSYDIDYEYRFDPQQGDGSDAISMKKAVDQLTEDEYGQITDDLAILPLLFPKKYNRRTIHQFYNYCEINLYLDSNDPRVKQIDMRNKPIWQTGDMGDALSTLQYGYSDYRKSETEDSMGVMNDHLAAYSRETLLQVNYSYDGIGKRRQFVNFLPGVTFVSFSTECGLSQDYRHGMWVWFEKKGGPDYYNQNYASKDWGIDPDYLGSMLKEFKPDPNDFIKFHIPEQITTSGNEKQAYSNSFYFN